MVRDYFQPPSTSSTSRIELAEEAASFMAEQRTYMALLKRYNPGIGMSQAERVRKVANRVGLSVPGDY